MACIWAWHTISLAAIPLSPALAKWTALQDQLQHRRATGQTYSRQEEDILSGLTLGMAKFTKRLVELRDHIALVTSNENERQDIMAAAIRKIIQCMDDHEMMTEPADH